MPPRILVVEDNPALATVIAFNLRHGGFDVCTAADGKEALEEAERDDSFAFFVTDEQMPRMTGTEFCRRLRRLTAYEHTPVVLLTAKCLELPTDEIRAELGICEVLAKPFSPRGLLQLVRKQLNMTEPNLQT